MTIQGQSLVIIGGSSGMGLAIAKKAVEADANVTIAARSRAKLDEARQAIAGDVTTHTVDVSEEQSVKTLFSKIGPFDHLVVPGSSVRSGPRRELSLADARASMDSKFWGQYLAARYAQIRSRGSITLFSGISSRRPSAGLASLASINAAVEALGRALAVELAPIRVNAISPGITIRPPMRECPTTCARRCLQLRENVPSSDALASPEDFASLALELMCNSFMTGIVVDVDGGALLGG